MLHRRWVELGSSLVHSCHCRSAYHIAVAVVEMVVDNGLARFGRCSRCLPHDDVPCRVTIVSDVTPQFVLQERISTKTWLLKQLQACASREIRG